MSREWLALVEMENENEKFSPSPLFLHQASSSRRDSLHPLSIVHCRAATSAFVALLLSKAAAAVAPVSSLFLPPTATQFMYVHTYIAFLDSQVGRIVKPSYSQLYSWPVAGDSPSEPLST